ncbi:MAG: hypothetical protein GC185_12015 [Alphaproteobacteria bacterium]|nr:hypothetical protein [Alphaproteobacteria bacterium]
MKKAKNIIIVLAVLIVAAGLFIFLNLNSGAKRLIETAGSAALGTKVSVSGLDISIADKKASMNGLSVANPPGFDAADIIKAKAISVKVDDVTRKLVTIDEVVVDGMTVNYELGKGGTNFDVLKKNMPGAGQSNGKSGGESGENTPSPEVIIHHLKILNAQVIPALGKNQAPISLPDLTLNNIGSKSNPATARQVAEKILAKVLSASSTAVITSGVTNSINKSVDNAAEKLKGLFGK